MFTQLLLADEINRAPAKTQSSLLEAMQERSVTIDGTTRPLPEPFFVIATQNPIESQGTYPLPEAQLDRFLFKLDVRHPTTANEKAILASHLAGFDASALDRMGLARVTTPEELVAMQTAIRGVRVDDSVLEYIADIVGRTRSHRSLYFGASPRASIALLAGAQARAVSRGPRLRHPRRRQGAGAGGDPPPRRLAARRRDRRRLGRRLRRRDPARGPRPRHHRRLTSTMPLVPTLRLVLLALAPAGARHRDGDRCEPARARCWPRTARCCCSRCSTRCWRSGRLVVVTREAPAVLSVGRANPVRLQLRSQARRRLDVTRHRRSARPTSRVDDLPARATLAARGRATVVYHLQPVAPRRRRARRSHTCATRRRSGCGSGSSACPRATSLKVYPDVTAVRVYELLARQSRENLLVRAVRLRGGENEFERLREYGRDDEYRNIDWKATARRGRLIVREYQQERNQTVVCLLDCGRLMTAESDGLAQLDHALNAVLMLSHVAARAGDQLGLMAFDARVRSYLPPAGGRRAAQRVAHATYDLHANLVETDFEGAFTELTKRLRKRALVVLFTQVIDDVSAQAVLRQVRSLRPRHLPVCVLFRDPDLDRLAEPTGGLGERARRRAVRRGGRGGDHPVARTAGARPQDGRRAGAARPAAPDHARDHQPLSTDQGAAPAVSGRAHAPGDAARCWRSSCRRATARTTTRRQQRGGDRRRQNRRPESMKRRSDPDGVFTSRI